MVSNKTAHTNFCKKCAESVEILYLSEVLKCCENCTDNLKCWNYLWDVLKNLVNFCRKWVDKCRYFYSAHSAPKINLSTPSTNSLQCFNTFISLLTPVQISTWVLICMWLRILMKKKQTNSNKFTREMFTFCGVMIMHQLMAEVYL